MLLLDIFNITTYVACGLALVVLLAMLSCAICYAVSYLFKAAIKDFGLLSDETKKIINWFW